MALQPFYEHDHLCSDVITKNARLYTNNIAVVCEHYRLTWAELDEATNQVANALLAKGLAKGSKVCLLMANSIESFIIFWGVIKAGCVIVPLNMMLDAPTLARLVNASDGEVFFVDGSMTSLVDGIRDELHNIRAENFYTLGLDRANWNNAGEFFQQASTANPNIKLTPADAMTLIYTSGTTGTPKGILHNHFGRLNYCYGFAAGLNINRHSVAICATPIYASGTWITMLPTLYNGGKIVLIPKFSAEAFLAAVDRNGGTHSFMVPAQYISILQNTSSSFDTSSLSVLVSAGQIMSLATRKDLAKRFPGTGLYEVYGMTEGFFTIAIPKDFNEKRLGTVGKPGFLEDIRIIGDNDQELATGETGEIVAYGPGMMQGYYGRPDLTEQTIWQNLQGRTYLRSGDLGHMDAEGYLYVSGRKKDMIKSGGINIYACDIEDVLMTHPDVAECAVVGVPHPRWSETPIAVIIPRKNPSASAADIRDWANDKLAKYQRLSEVFFVDDFPRATYGKIKKDDLRSRYNALFS